MKVAILYICTGRYSIFWEEFFKNSESFFLPNYEKHYFVFTDADDIYEKDNIRVHPIFEDTKEWPFVTLYRFKIFLKVETELREFDYIFFFNSNMRFLETIGEEILPNIDEKLLGVQHPGGFGKTNVEFSYDRNIDSTAYIPYGEGTYYFMGGFNGGRGADYLELIKELNSNIDIDYNKNIIALWHDESHLNRYLLNRNIKVLDASYGYPEGRKMPFKPKVIILDKTNFGGHDFLRGKSNKARRNNFINKVINKVFNKVKKWL